MSFETTDETKPAVPSYIGEISSDELKRMSREQVEQGLAGLAPLASHLDEFFVEIPVESSDGSVWQSLTKVIRPKLDERPGKPRPLVVYFYGGGFVAGDADTLTLPGRDWADKFNATVVLPSYRLTPHFRFPVPMTDGTSVLKTIASGWVASSHQPYFGASPQDGFIVAGQSAGAIVAGVAAGLGCWSEDPKDKLQVPLTGVFFVVPWFFRPETVPEEYRSIFKSEEENEHDEALSLAQVNAVYDSLHVPDPRSPLLTPAWFFQDGREPPRGVWPPTYFQACQRDPIRDQAVVFEKMLAKIGTKTKIHILPEDGHTGVTVIPQTYKSRNPTIEENTMDALEWLLEQQR